MKTINIFVIGSIFACTCTFFAGRISKNLKSNESSDVCTKDRLCGNALEANKRLRDYQISLHMDTVWLYDGDRLVGSYISNWKNQMDSFIVEDNQ